MPLIGAILAVLRVPIETKGRDMNVLDTMLGDREDICDECEDVPDDSELVTLMHDQKQNNS